ncbi:MAG: UDP-N-acetyl-D-mannosamine dehydrogenase [Phycisphaerales bacterium]|nr:UDP-N-acetyl-D-mannosamine dehydrogenase [Phycisphaerales bacterium]
MTPKNDFERICVIGLGYIGLPTSAALAARGFSIHGVEVNASVVETINAGDTHIVEPELDLLVRAAVEAGRLKAHLEPAEADVFMICVPTPIREDKTANLDYVWSAAKQIAPFVKSGNLVLLESTSPPRTTERVAEIVATESGLAPGTFHVAHAPERVLPGRILREVVENDRIIGGINDASTEVAARFYEKFVSGRILETTARTAEMAKLVENSFRDVNIAFANELSVLCEELEIDVWELIGLANRHPRVEILSPGPGVGGHCLAVDPWFIVELAPKSSNLIRTAREVNEAKPHWVVDRVRRKAERFKNPKIACLGLAYKPDVDDLRESPAVEITEQLVKAGIGDVWAVEPFISEHSEIPLRDLQSGVEDADIVLLLVGHRQFKRMPHQWLREKVVFDICGLFHRSD